MFISASVGQGGRNQAADVLVIQHMLSARGQWMTPCLDVPRNSKADETLFAAIRRFQKEVVGLRSPDGRVDAPGKSLAKLESELAISNSVGYSGKNMEGDVFIIQTLLSLHPNVNSVCYVPGRYSMDMEVAINNFQKDVVKLSHPDGRVDPGGRTYKALIGLKSGGGTQPSKVRYSQFSASTGCYSYATSKHQWATQKTIASLHAAAKKFYEQEGFEIGIGHLSLSGGENFPPHKSHRTGRDADIRPIRVDGAHSPINISSASQYDREKTQALVDILRADANLRQILFNDSKINSKYANVKYYKGHDDHLHVSFNS